VLGDLQPIDCGWVGLCDDVVGGVTMGCHSEFNMGWVL
jgi:hypothetical protein